MSEGIFTVSGASIAGIDVFSDLNAAERSEIAKLCRGCRYKTDQLIVSHHDDNRDVFFILSGTVRVTTFSRAGKEIMFRDETAGQMFGELSAIDGKPRSAHVIALTDSSLAFISPEHFWEILRNYPKIAEKTFKYLTNLVRLLSDRVIEFSTLGVRNRIHAELLRLGLDKLGDDGSAVISPVPTHAEIASRVSTHREAVTREIGILDKSGLIKKTRGSLIIQDIDRLQKMVHDVLGD